MGKVRTMSRRRIHSGALVDDSWQPPSLTASERAYMIRKAKEASVALVDHAHTLDGPVQWHYTGKLRGIQMYRGEGCYDRAGTSGTEFLCGVTTMLGSIEEVANYFNQQTTEKMLAKKAEDVLDCAVLYSLAEGDSNNPFYRVSAKYQLYEGPSAFSRERDYCFLECQNTFRHASGRRGWVLSMHSIKLPNCPEMDGVVRGSMYQSGYVFVEAEKEGYMDVMHSLQINFKSTSRLPHFMLNAALKRRILSVVTISREIQTTRMGRQTLLKKKQLMPKRSRALCVNCARKFSLFVRKTRCRVCGEVVCQPCAPQVMISTKQGPVKTRVCTRCCHLSADDDYEPISTLHNSPNGAHMRRMQNVTRYSDILQDQHDHPDMYHEEDEDCLEEDDDEDGLEEQSDYSVFAQSRFTDASRNSFATSQYGSSRFESRFEGTSQFDTSSKFDESQYYDGGSSENSFVSGTSSSRWKGSSSAASSMSGRNQASSVKHADGHNYDPQASANSNFYGASNYGSDYGGSKHTLDEESVKRAGRYNAAAPIPEDEPFSRRSHKASTNRSHNSNKDYNSTKDSSYASAKSSSVKATQGTKYDLTNVSQNSDSKHASKTLSIQSLAKARSARYGIKSQFPVPPPPPPFSPPPEQHEESYEHDSPLHLGSLMMNDHQSLKDQKPKGIATRKIFTPPPLKEGRCEIDRVSAKRVPQVAQNMAFNAASANRHSRVSQTSSIDSSGFGNTRASAILEQVRRNRGRTLQYSPEGDRTLAVLKSTERENLIRMREMERMQESAKEKAARRSMASNGSRIAVHATQNDASSGAGARRKKEDRRRSSRHFIAGSSLHSLRGAPPGSPPGTPPSMRGRRLPNSAPFNSQPNRSFRDNHSRRADASGDFEGSQILSNRSNTSFARSGARVSLISSGQSEDLTFRSQGPGHRITTKDSKHVNGQGLDGSQGSNKRFTSSFGNRQLDDSCALIIPESRHPDDLVFSESQLLLDKAKFSSSIAILETGESREHFAMMERFSEECSLGDSLLSEDLLSQSLSGMNEHINSMRAVAAYKLPDEEDRLSDELRGRQEEHRKRMEELNKLTANHVVGTRDRTSTLGDLHDSSVSLMGYSGNYFGDSTISSVSPASSVEIDDEEFDFGSRPFGRTKRSGTIFFALEEFEQAPDAEDSDELSEGLDDSNTSICQSEEYAEHDMIKLEDGYRSNEEFACENAERSLPAYRFSGEYVKTKHEHENESIPASYRSSEEHMSGFATPPRRSSVRIAESEHEKYSGCVTPPRSPNVESVESEHKPTNGLATPPRRASEGTTESRHEHMRATPSRRSSVESEESEYDRDTGFITSPRRSSVEYEESDYDRTSGLATPTRRSSVESVKSEHDQASDLVTLPRCLIVEVVKTDHDQNTGFATPPRRLSVEPAKIEHDQVAGFVTSPRRLSVESEKSEHDRTSGLATPTRRSSVKSVKSEHDRISGLATPTRRSSVESVKSEHDQASDLVTLPRFLSVEVVKTDHDQNTGFATLPRRLSVEPAKIEHDQVAGFVTPPRRLSVESEESEHDQTSGIATPPRRFSVEAAAPVKSGHDQVAGFVTPPRRLSVESEKSEHAQTSGIATPPRRFSVEAAAPVKSGHDQVAGFVTPPRRLSVESEESEHDQTSGIATPPRRFSVEAPAPVKSGHDQVAGFVAPPRRLSVESEESEHDQTSGIATPPRRFSVESVESEHEPNCALHRSSAESESDCEQQTSFVTPPFRHNMESEHIQTNGFVTIPRHESVESAESKREYESESDSARLSYCSSEDSMEHERDGDLGDAAHRSGEKSVDNEHENGYEDAKSAYSSVKHQSYLEHVESAYCLNNGIELDEAVVVPKRPSNEPFVPPTNMSNFQLNSSQLIFGEGGLAVDEFIADSSRLLSNCMLYQVDENGDEGTCSPCDTSELHHLRLTSNTSEECNLLKTPLSKSRFGTDMLEHVTSPRESCMSAIDEELMNRPTNELFDMIRANRPIYNSDGSRSVEMMYDLEASHMRRMEELNCIAIDHLGNRISNLSDDMLGSAFQPGRSLYPGFRNEEKEMQWRSSDVMEEVQSKHQVDMERLRRRIRQLEEECRESIASVLTTEEMDLSEFDDDDNRPTSRGFVGRQSFNPQTSYMDRSDLSSSTISEHGTTDMPPQIDEPLPAQVLFEQIAQLTRLQQEMVEGEGDEDEEECRKRMKEQYRVLRSIKANSRQERELLSHQERGSLSEDEENWI